MLLKTWCGCGGTAAVFSSFGPSNLCLLAGIFDFLSRTLLLLCCCCSNLFLCSEFFRCIALTGRVEFLHMCSCKEIKYYSWKLWDQSCHCPGLPFTVKTNSSLLMSASQKGVGEVGERVFFVCLLVCCCFFFWQGRRSSILGNHSAIRRMLFSLFCD